MKVRIFTRQGCPLCEKGIAAAVAVFGEDNIELIDVDLDLALMERYTTRVPVIETLDGDVLAEGIIDQDALRWSHF